MNELLKALYDNFYEPLPETELKKEIEACHRQLIETLDKPERRLVLQIIDNKDQIAENAAECPWMPSSTLPRNRFWAVVV